jgi:arylsulfatase A-like enzyme
MTDDQGYNEITSSNKLSVPNIEALAARGMTMNRTYTIPLCAPSRWSFYTGLSSGHGSVTNNGMDGMVPIPKITLPKLMKSHGYLTSIIGKYGPGNNQSISSAFKMGFMESFIYPYTVDAHYTFPLLLEENGKRINYYQNYKANQARCLNGKCVYGPDLFMYKVKEFLTRNFTMPFFLVICPNIPHVGIFPGAPNVYTSPVPSINGVVSANYALSGHASMITNYIDEGLGTINQLLVQRKLINDTYVIFYSDNGAEPTLLGINAFFNSNYPLRGGKRSVYEGGIRVPFIIAGPNIPKGVINGFPIAIKNMMNTITDLVSINWNNSNYDSSYKNLFFGKPFKDPNNITISLNGNTAVIIVKDYPNKLIKVISGGNQLEVYDLINDPSEIHRLGQ